MLKKIKYIIYTMILFVLGAGISNAASLSVNANKKTVTVGSTVTVTVNASGAAGWEYCVAYDSSMFTLTKATSDTGGACVRTGSTLTGYSSVSFTFKANKSGTSTVSLRSAVMYGDDGNEISSSKGSVSLTAKTQQEIEASYSSNADLRSLVVEGYEISPAFSKNVLEYNLEVENDIEKVNIVAAKDDNRSSIKGAGEVVLSEGINKIEIVVTAQKGNNKTYILNITRKELNPIIVKVDGKEYNVVRKAENLEAPTYYSSTTIKIDDEDIPAFESEITGFTLVGLKDEDGNIKLYRYENGEYTLYNQIAKDSFVFIPLDNNEILKGYENKRIVSINDVEVVSYTKNEDDKEIVLVYGMNASTGDKNWYKYDTKEGTFQRYIKSSEQESLTSNEYFYLAIAFASGLGLAILIIIILLAMNSGKDKKNKKLVEMIENKLSLLKKEVKNKEDNLKSESTKNLEEDIDEKELEKLNNQFLSFIDQEAQEEREQKEMPEETLSKRELRKLEKEKKKKEELELKAMQNDFLETRENTLVSDTDILDEIIEKANDTKTSKKKKSEVKSKKSKK